MVSMAKVLITQQRICNFRYHCLAQLQVVKTMIWSLNRKEIYIYLKVVILNDYICAIESSSSCLL